MTEAQKTEMAELCLAVSRAVNRHAELVEAGDVAGATRAHGVFVALNLRRGQLAEAADRGEILSASYIPAELRGG